MKRLLFILLGFSAFFICHAQEPLPVDSTKSDSPNAFEICPDCGEYMIACKEYYMPTFEENDVSYISSYVSQRIKYPAYAREHGIQGRVMCSFLVDSTGKVREVEVIKGVHPTLDNEAVRQLKYLPRLEPGRRHERRVSVRFTVPIYFIIDDR